MKKKNAAIICMSGILSAALLLGGCGDKNPDPSAQDSVEKPSGSGSESEQQSEEPEVKAEVQMWDGYYSDTSTGTLSFIRFNEDGSYYSSYFDKAVTDAGMWEVLNEELEYSVDAGPDGDANTVEDNTKATASQVVALTSYQSGDTVKIAYVEDQLCDMSMAGLANHRNMTHDPEYAYNPATDETPIQLYVFYAGNSVGSNITLSHDRSFVDVTGDAFMDGTWEMKEAGVYSLTYSDDTTAVLTVDPSGKSAVLEKADGSTLELSYTFEEEGEAGGVVTSLRAEDQQVGLPMSVALRLDCLRDGTCQLIIEVAQTGQEMLVDQGTYTVTETYKYLFTFDEAGELESVPDYENASEAGLDMTLAYKADIVLEADGQTAQFNIDSVLEGKVTPGQEGEAGGVVTSLRAEDQQVGLPMSVALRLDCLEDGTCQLIIEVAQTGQEMVVDQGTYTVTETYKYLFTFDVAGELESVPDYANASEAGLDMTLAYKADIVLEADGQTAQFNIDSVLEGKVMP